MKKIEILDSTLRDGAQGEGISFSVQDKLNIVKALDDFGVTYIEAGNPGSNPKDIEFFKKASEMRLKNARLCAFGSTRRKNVPADQDENILSLLKANTPTVVVFGKVWILHVMEILKIQPEENLEIIRDTVEFLKNNGKEVIFDAEHFFDGYKADPEYAVEVIRAAVTGGADKVCLCDTNGGTFPLEIYGTVTAIKGLFPGVKTGIHCHNDTGCGAASSVTAVEAGAEHVQGTFIGFGERCGNADLSVVIPDLQLKLDYRCVEGDLGKLTETALKIAEIANLSIGNDRPYIGRSAFAHKGGMHIDGVKKVEKSFEHIDPSLVGNSRRFLMSEVSGRTTVLAKVKDIFPELTKKSGETALIVERLKSLEHEGYQFEAADASFELLAMKILGKYTPYFKLIMYKTTGEYPSPDGSQSSSAILKICVDGSNETAAAMGNGPVNALDTALRKALTVFYPELSSVHLTDYKVRVLGAEDATAAKVRVLIESSDGVNVWTTVGVSTDIVEASWLALVDSIEYKLSGLRKGE